MKIYAQFDRFQLFCVESLKFIFLFSFLFRVEIRNNNCTLLRNDDIVFISKQIYSMFTNKLRIAFTPNVFLMCNLFIGNSNTNN